uniref:Tetraspanin n=1 Tax=Panagrolaimus superbus TaxID=310955 RepID=A0A914ZCL6_9BILA
MDISVIATYAGIGVQFFTSACGIIGVICSNRDLLRIYWVFMIPLIAFDFISAIIWAFKFNFIHRDFNSYFNNVIADELQHNRNLTGFCTVFKDVHDELFCCPKLSIRNACRGDWEQCRISNKQDCIIPLLHWLHSEIDPLAGILYFLLTPLKMMVVFVLREDMMELLTEIIYRGDPSLYRKHWMSYDSDDEESMINSSSQSSSGHSSSRHQDKGSEKSLLQIKALAKEPRIIMNPQARDIKRPKIIKDTSSSSTSE